MHDVLNELLHTDNSYYKNAEIQLVLDTIHDKMCKFVLQPDNIDEQPSQQQSPDEIPEAEEITDKMAEIEDMEELDERSVKSITGLFAALQMCDEDSAKMVTSSTPSATSSTSSATPMDMESEVPTIEVSSEQAIPKK